MHPQVLECLHPRQQGVLQCLLDPLLARALVMMTIVEGVVVEEEGVEEEEAEVEGVVLQTALRPGSLRFVDRRWPPTRYSSTTR